MLFQALGVQAGEILHSVERQFDEVFKRLDRLAERSVGGPERAQQATPKAQPDPVLPREGLEAGTQKVVHFSRLKRVGGPPVADRSELASFDFQKDWGGWRHNQAVRMEPSGKLILDQDKSTPGIASPEIPTRSSGLVRVVVELAISADAAQESRPHIRVMDEEGRSVGPDQPIRPDRSEHFFFCSLHTKAIRVMLVFHVPKIGFGCAFQRLRVAEAEPESYYENVRVNALAPIVASIASIPERESVLQDAVSSLLVQCDRVRVFLNHYDVVPQFLRHPRIEVRRSQDWDDKGDAGKFAWIEDEGEPGYRLTADDDLIFPPDYAQKMSECVNSYQNRALVGLHGILLKQPVTAYYEEDSRTAFHFQDPLPHDRTCHVVGTGTMAYYSDTLRMRYADFMYRNMADVFVAKYAKSSGLALVAMARPANWVRQNPHSSGLPSIYESSLKRTKSAFDSSAVQDGLVKWNQPFTVGKTHRPKVALILLASDPRKLSESVSSWERTRGVDSDWSVILQPIKPDAALLDYLRTLRTPHELHILPPSPAGGAGALAEAIRFAKSIGFRLCCIAVDGLQFTGGQWTKAALRIVCRPILETCIVLSWGNSQMDASVGGIPDGKVPLAYFGGASDFERRLLADACGSLTAFCSHKFGMTNRSVQEAGNEFASHFGVTQPFGDGLDDPAGQQTSKEEKQTRNSRAHPFHARLRLTVNDFFERVVFLNLTRRSDRHERMMRRLALAGIAAERFPAVDGQAAETFAEYQQYLARPLVSEPVGPRPVTSIQQFYQDYDSDVARVAYLERIEQKKAIRSAGAWAYLKGWEELLRQVIEKRTPTTLVFDDNVVFHRQTPSLFGAAMAELPDDWLILQLGTLQSDWRPDWIKWRGKYLYQTNGFAAGSHAVGFRFEIAAFLLEHVKRMLLPFDSGALASASRAFENRCLVVAPNIAIPSFEDCSDINTAAYQNGDERDRIAGIYRWNLEDYAL